MLIEAAKETVQTKCYAANVLPIILEARKAGARTLREIAESLNAQGIAFADFLHDQIALAEKRTQK